MGVDYHLSASQLIPVLESMEDDVVLNFVKDEWGGLMFVGNPKTSGAIRISQVSYELIGLTDNSKEALAKIYKFMEA